MWNWGIKGLFPVVKEKDNKTLVETKIEVSIQSESKLMWIVCRQWSPMCDDWDMYHRAKEIFEARWVDFWIALWIMNAESTLGKNYARWCDASYHNWGGIKWRLLDDWTRVKDQPIPDSNGCWMYKFDSMEDYFQSKANTLWLWYKTCFTHNQEIYSKIKCISYAYVWDRNVAEQSWINNVFAIAKYWK